MRPFLATFLAILTICAFTACESAGATQYDGVSRFAADAPYSDLGAPDEAPPAPEIPGNAGSSENI